MSFEYMVTILSRLSVESVVTFLSILLWSKTRDTAWMFVILGVIVSYGESVFQTLRAFGIVNSELLVLRGVPVFNLVLSNLPMLFFAVAFIIMIFRRSLR